MMIDGKIKKGEKNVHETPQSVKGDPCEKNTAGPSGKPLEKQPRT